MDERTPLNISDRFVSLQEIIPACYSIEELEQLHNDIIGELEVVYKDIFDVSQLSNYPYRDWQDVYKTGTCRLTSVLLKQKLDAGCFDKYEDVTLMRYKGDYGIFHVFLMMKYKGQVVYIDPTWQQFRSEDVPFYYPCAIFFESEITNGVDKYPFFMEYISSQAISMWQNANPYEDNFAGIPEVFLQNN